MVPVSATSSTTSMRSSSTTDLGEKISPHLNLESSLCFPKDIFYASTFDVDAFLSHYKREYTLERLRDDLNVFLKVLEMSMCELINKDYPDFVNLSTNLVDLEKGINDLKTPLETIKNEVDSVKNSIDQEIELVVSKLNEKLIIEKRRIVLKLLMNWQRSLKVTNEMIGNNSGDKSKKINGDHLERLAFEFCQLKNSLSICSGENKDIIAQNNDIDKLSQMLEKIMQDLFLTCFNLKDLNDGSLKILNEQEMKKQMKPVLKSYALLSKQRMAEQLYLEHVVKPYMNFYLNESYLQTNIRRLTGVYEKVLEFVDQNSEFLKIANEIKSNYYYKDASGIESSDETSLDQQQQQQQIHKSNEFDFILNSIWSCVVACLDLNLNGIFSPADPDLFHQNFTISFDFLAKLEAKCAQYDKELKRKLLTSQTYKFFVKKWPVQVYYQIRFQEIVSKFEEDLLNYTRLVSNDDDRDEQVDRTGHNVFYLNVTDTLVKQMEICWQESKCFLKCLLSQFWKLNLQLISRYCLFFIKLFQDKLALSSLSNAEYDDGTQWDVSHFSKSDSSYQTIGSKSSLDDISLCVILINDVDKLFTNKLPNFYDGVIAPVMRSCNAVKEITLLKEAFNSSLQNLNKLQSFLIDFIVNYETEKCLNSLNNANDIPRLYRRTNREIPKVASMYVGLTVDVISDFKQTHGNSKKSERQQILIDRCIQSIIDSICIKYQSIASDLLEKVKKMEDSLKMLYRVKHSNRSNVNLTSLSSGSIVSDDDKIRIQLYIDIVEFGKLLAEKFNGYRGDSNYDALYKLVEEINTNILENINNPSNQTASNNPAANVNLNNNSNMTGSFVLEENETNPV